MAAYHYAHSLSQNTSKMYKFLSLQVEVGPNKSHKIRVTNNFAHKFSFTAKPI